MLKIDRAIKKLLKTINLRQKPIVICSMLELNIGIGSQCNAGRRILYEYSTHLHFRGFSGGDIDNAYEFKLRALSVEPFVLLKEALP